MTTMYRQPGSQAAVRTTASALTAPVRTGAAHRAPTPATISSRCHRGIQPASTTRDDQEGKAMTQRNMLTGAQIVVRCLEHLGVDQVFGLPGGAILPVYDALGASGRIRRLLVRHEQSAGHAAIGYALSSGRPAVCIAGSGPAATNLVTALGDALIDSVPLVAITGQVRSELIGTDAFQETDVVGITMPVTKHSMQVTRAEDIAPALASAWELAANGRPGPVLVDITQDAQEGAAPYAWPGRIEMPGFRPVTKPNAKQVRQAAVSLAASQRPVLYVGGGVVRAGAAEQLAALADLSGAPVVTTMPARGVLPESHPHNLGMPGMYGTVPAVLALQRADLVVALGARFADRVTGRAGTFAPMAKVVHVDIDPAEISKLREADVPIVGDLAEVLAGLVPAYREVSAHGHADLTPWWAYLDGLRTRYPNQAEDATELVSPQRVLQRIGAASGPDAVYATGAGQHQVWAANFLPLDRPRHFLSPCGAGTPGFGLPAAMGAQLAHPGAPVWAIEGDGGFQISSGELAACAAEGLPIKVAIMNNGSLGMVRQWQSLFFDERHVDSDLQPQRQPAAWVPDFSRLAEAYGATGITVDAPDQVDAAIRTALDTDDRPVVLNFLVSPQAMVWPMVPDGVSNDFIQYRQGRAPAFEQEDAA